MWAYLLSTWFLAKRNTKGELDDKELYDFLCYITGFIYACFPQHKMLPTKSFLR